MQGPITPFIHKVHTYNTYYHISICTDRRSQGERAHPPFHAYGTHVFDDIIIFADTHSTAERAILPTDSQD